MTASTTVSTFTPELIRNCRRCSAELLPGALACEKCHALVYSEQLELLADEAKDLEARGEQQRARERWLSGLPLLPPTSRQASWITEHVRALGGTTQTVAPQSISSHRDGRLWKRGSVGLGFLVSFALFVAVYWKASGARFGIGFAILILIHEMGHFVDIRRRGLPADMPLFLPGVGAYVRWRALGVSLETRAAISLAGPLAGCLAAVACGALWWQTHDPYWLVLARVGAALNLLNLIPVWMLDGGQAASALNKMQRLILLMACLGLWLVFGEKLFLLVALGAAYRAFFAGDVPPRPSTASLVYFIGVLTGLAAIMYLLPGRGFSLR